MTLLTDTSWDDLKLFLICARTESFRQAAQKLGLTSSTVVRRIGRLESELGVSLFERLPNGVRLTREASKLVGSVNQIEQGTFDFQRRIETFDPKKRGIVRVSVTEGLGTFWLMPKVVAFQRANPMMVIDLSCQMDVADVSRREADIAIQFQMPDNPNVVRQRIGTLHDYPYASRRYADIYGLPTGRDEILDHRLIDQIGPQLDEGVWPRFLGIEDIEGVVGIRTNSSAAHFYAVERGAGIGLMPTYATAIGANVIPVDIGFHHRIDIWMTYHPDAKKIPRVAMVIDWLSAAFDQRKYPWFRSDFIHPTSFAEADTSAWRENMLDEGSVTAGDIRDLL